MPLLEDLLPVALPLEELILDGGGDTTLTGVANRPSSMLSDAGGDLTLSGIASFTFGQVADNGGDLVASGTAFRRFGIADGGGDATMAGLASFTLPSIMDGGGDSAAAGTAVDTNLGGADGGGDLTEAGGPARVTVALTDGGGELAEIGAPGRQAPAAQGDAGGDSTLLSGRQLNVTTQGDAGGDLTEAGVSHIGSSATALDGGADSRMTNSVVRGGCLENAGEQLPPDNLADISNLSGNLNAVQENPFVDDGLWMNATLLPPTGLPPVTPTTVTFNFPTPSIGPLVGTQSMAVRVRTSFVDALDPLVPALLPPTMQLTVRDSGGVIASATYTVPSSYPNGLVFIIDFDAAQITDPPTVALHFEGDPFIITVDNVSIGWTVEPGAARWYVNSTCVIADLDGGTDTTCSGRKVITTPQLLDTGGDVVAAAEGIVRSAAARIEAGGDLTIGRFVVGKPTRLDGGGDIFMVKAAPRRFCPEDFDDCDMVGIVNDPTIAGYVGTRAIAAGVGPGVFIAGTAKC